MVFLHGVWIITRYEVPKLRRRGIVSVSINPTLDPGGPALPGNPCLQKMTSSDIKHHIIIFYNAKYILCEITKLHSLLRPLVQACLMVQGHQWHQEIPEIEKQVM